MTATTCSTKLNAGQSECRRTRRMLFAILPWLMVAPLLTNCGSSTAIIAGAPPGPPAHDNAWLSYKVSRTCGPIASCAGLLDFKDTNGPNVLSEASMYYCSIGVDAAGCASGTTPQYSFSQWKTDNGFPATGFPPAHAFYFNKGDLQLGRDMNCVQNGQNVACYVSNYGPLPFLAGKENPAWPDPEAAIDAAINQTPPTDPNGNVNVNGLFATVAMIFNPTGVGPNGDTVTFYVFNAQGNLVNNAALDGEGGKSVPRMCMACHGGTYTPNSAGSFPYNSKAPGINFLPFDLWFFHYKEGGTSNSIGNADLQEGFRQLNKLVKITHTNQQPTASDTAILESIKDQYNQTGRCGGQNQPPCGVDNQGSQVPADPPPPTGWSTNPNLYSTVFRPYCRMCHLGQGGLRDLTFDKVSNFPVSEIPTFACGTHDMPHAEVALGGQSGSSLKSGLWWDLQALDDLNAFLNVPGGCH
jgi:hypothetical protein